MAIVITPQVPCYYLPSSHSGIDMCTQDAELAWHFYLPGLTSGYMYYGAVEDMPVKQTVACNNAVAHVEKTFEQLRSSYLW